MIWRVELSRVRLYSLSLWTIVVVAQTLPTLDGVAAGTALLVWVGGVLGISLCLRTDLLRGYPISTSMLLGYVASYFLLPPVATALELKPLTFNLDHPLMTLLQANVLFIGLLFAHVVYRSRFFQTIRYGMSEGIFRPLGFFTATSNAHLLAIGCIGLLAMFYQVFVLGGAQQQLMGAGNKFIQGLFPLAYVPYSIVLKRLLGDERPVGRQWLLIILGYTFILLIVSFGRNSRAFFFLGITSIALAYLYGVAVGLYSTRAFRLKNVLFASLALVIVFKPAADLAKAMVVVRGERTDVSATELLFATLDAMRRSDLSNAYKNAFYHPLWNEHYVDNAFLSRLCNLKYPDATLDLAMNLSDSGLNYVREMEWERVVSILPRPVIVFLDLAVDKDVATSGSGGDVLLFAQTNSSNIMGGFRAGSLLGQGYALFGWLYPAILSVIAVVIYIVADAQSSRQFRFTNIEWTQWTPIIAPLTLATYYKFCFFWTSAAEGSENVASLIGFMTRGWIQTLFLYSFVYFLTIPLAKFNKRLD